MVPKDIEVPEGYDVGVRCRVSLRWHEWPYSKRFEGEIEQIDQEDNQLICTVGLDNAYQGVSIIEVPLEEVTPILD